MNRTMQGSKKKARQLRQAASKSHEAVKDDLIRVIGGYILEHGELQVDMDLARLSQGMKLKVSHVDGKIYFHLLEADGSIYTVPEVPDGSRLQSDGGSAGILGREDDVQRVVQDKQLEDARELARDLDPHTEEETYGKRD